MKRKEIIRQISWFPAWGWSLLAAFCAAVIISTLTDIVDPPIIYVIYGLLLVLASFLICIIHPENVWSVPFLCNILALLPAACDNTFWNSSFGIIIGTGIVFSVIMAHLGALIGKRKGR